MAHAVLGRCYAARKDYREAIVQYRMAINADPRDARTHVNLATVLVACGQFRDAVDECVAALQLRPNWPPPTTTSAVL